MASPLLPTKIRRSRVRAHYFGGYLPHRYLYSQGKPALAKLIDFDIERRNYSWLFIPFFHISKVHCRLEFMDDEGRQRILELKKMPGHVLETIQDLVDRQIPEIYIPIRFDPQNPDSGIVDWVGWQRS